MKTSSTSYLNVITEKVNKFQIMPIKYYMPMSSVEKLRELLGRAFIGIQASLPFDGIEQYQVSFSTPFRDEANAITEYFQFLKDRLLDTTSPNCNIKFIRGSSVEWEMKNIWVDEMTISDESFQIPFSAAGPTSPPSVNLFNINLLISCTLMNLEL